MQYHFPDGTSLLRMHRPFYYGDSLAEFRQTIMDANAEMKPVKGFENGRHLLAYRFVYPLKLDGENIGSVEMAVGLSQIIQHLNRVYGIGYSYIIEKDKVFQDYTAEVVGNFKKNSISDKYFMQSCNACINAEDDSCSLEDIRSELLYSIKVRNKERLNTYTAFSEIVKDNGDTILITYLPIIDYNGNGSGYIISHGIVYDYRTIIKEYLLLFVTISMVAVCIILILAAMDNSRRRAKNLSIELEKKVSEKIVELEDKEHFFAQQTKMATMGEMMTSIMHQWKQPINSISMISDIILFEGNKKCDDEDIIENLKHIKDQAFFMSQTGSDFMNFMKPSKNKSVFNVAEAVEEVLNLFEFSFERYNIGFRKEFCQNVKEYGNIMGYPNEFKHVMLNFFNNSRDAIVAYREEMVSSGKDVADFKGVIGIKICIEDNNVIVRVSDTGGGIPFHVMPRIFEKHFSTKDSHGSGIGLYMTKEMVEKSMNGKISVNNTLDGAEFTLEFSRVQL